WESPDGIEAHVAPLGPEAADRVRETSPAVCVVNLAAPGALAAAVGLRTAGVATRLWACAIAADAADGLMLGAFDVVERPVDSERAGTRLAPLVNPGANVIMVGSESASLIPLRQGLLQAGMSVRTAWNRDQAVALADAVRPDLVVVDVAADAARAAELLV